MPAYQTEDAAGVDLRAHITAAVVLKPLERALIPTGLFLEIPKGYEAQVRPRSGLALKHGITVLNTPGTIDADYRGEIKVLLVNLSSGGFHHREWRAAFAQMVFAHYEKATFEEVETLSDTVRGTGGYGSTGVK